MSKNLEALKEGAMAEADEIEGMLRTELFYVREYIAALESALCETAKTVHVDVTFDAALVKQAFIDLWRKGELSPQFAHEMMEMIRQMEKGGDGR